MGNKTSRSASASQVALDALLSRPSALHASLFSLRATAHHGVPSNAKLLAFCGLQGLLAVGTASGAVKLYGANGLEFLLEGPESASHLAVGVTHLKFTARQRLVVGYSDSSIRVFDLASGVALCCVSDSWTTSTLISLETISYTNFPFFFVATDDGEIHVVHEETGRVSTYVIRPQDLPIPNAEGVTAMASHPRDSNLLLIAYDTCPAVLLWDFAKRKVVREFTLSGKTHKLSSPQSSLTPSEASSADGDFVCNSPQSLSWHSSGKRFVAGYKQGGFAIFRTDKSHGLYRCVIGAAQSDQTTPVKQIKWVCAPPTSRHAALPGAIVFSGGRADPNETNLLTLVYPPSDGRSSDDALTDLFKAEKFTWLVDSITSANHAEIAAFETAHDQVDYCAKMAPLSLIVLSGNPLDGCLPIVSVQNLPCFVKLCDGDKEEWEWRLNRLPGPAVIPPLLQLSPLKTFALVNLSHSDSALQDDLLATWNQAKYNPIYRVSESGDFEWPINGGSVLEPMLKGFLATSDAMGGETGIAPNSTMILTGHANGFVLFWEAQTAGDRLSKGAIRLLHVVDVPLQISPAPVSAEITCLEFCADSRTLVVGFASGEIAVLEFDRLKQCEKPAGEQQVKDFAAVENVPDQDQNIMSPDLNASACDVSVQGADLKEVVGFRTLFSIHVHSEPISKLALSSSYGYVAIADTAGMVSLVELKKQSFQLLVCEITPACDESLSVDSLLVSELVQTTEIPGSGSSPPSSISDGGGKGSPGRPSIGSGDASRLNVIQHREVIPVLFVGRGSGKLEMYHVQSATKMGETLVDPDKTSGLSSIIMIDGNGKRVDIPGHKWLEKDRDLSATERSLNAADAAASSDMVTPELVHDAGVCAEGFRVLGESAHISEAGAFGELVVDVNSVVDIDRPRFLVCTCGKAIHVVQTTVPRAAEMAKGPKEIPAQPLASIELKGIVLVTSVVRVPVGEGIENCLAVIDQSNHVYILSLLSLKPIWETECNNFGFGLGCNGLVDGILSNVSYGGELVVANTFGEVERFSLFAESTAMESAMLERMSIKTRLHLAERVAVFGQASSPSANDSGKKRGIAADAGKMFKKLVLSVTQEATDLNKIFQFSTEEGERRRLMGDRVSTDKDAAASESSTAKAETGLNATKDALMQAHQRLAERGDKLNDLGLKTEQMKKTSEDFYQTMKAFNEKNANKKWYEF